MALALLALPAAAQKREVIELTKEVELLRQEVQGLRQTVERDNAVLKQLVEQALDAVNRMGATMRQVEQSVQETQANTNTRVDSMSTQVQSLRDAVDELTARVGILSQQLAETRSVLETVDARLAGSGAAPTVTGGSAPPPTSGRSLAPSGSTSTQPPPVPVASPPSAQALYDNALRDLNTGKYDLARQQFTEYLQYYSQTALAGNAQFYIGETYYRQNDFNRAIQEYDRVLRDYPESNKVAGALLKKGYAQLELNQRDQGVATLRLLVERYPRAEESRWARRRLELLGEPLSR
jgi:tol-pal system protein YbgF